MQLNFLVACLCLQVLPFLVFSAKVDTLEVPSAAMKKNLRAAVVLPESYQSAAQNKTPYPVLYLLHGGLGEFSDWLKKTPDKMLVQKLADQYNLIIVMPDGEPHGFYLDSPVKKDNLFETYVAKEVIEKIDNTYRTIRNRKGRVITGLSMGGHGAMYLAARHPDVYCAAGTMSGAIDLNPVNWGVTPEYKKQLEDLLTGIIGLSGTTPNYASYSVLQMTDKLKANGLKLIIDCGVDDLLIEPNRELHRRLVYNKTDHDYTERPGGHTWEYWQNSLPNHLMFFHKVLKANGSLTQ